MPAQPPGGLRSGGAVRPSRIAATALLVLAVPGAVAVFAQTASQITPRTFEPSPPTLGGAVVFSGQPGLEAPPGADRLSVTVSGVSVEGGLPEMAPATTALENRLVGKPVPVSEIFAAAQSLEEAYAQAGYVLARVVIPQQSLRERRAAAARRGQRLHRAPRHRRRSRAGARADRPRRRAPRRPAQPQARRDRAPAADRGRHLRRRAPLGSVARRRSGRRGPRGRGGLPSRHRLDRDRQHPVRPARHLDARDRRRDQQRLQARRDDLLPRLGLPGRRRRGWPRRPLHRLSAHPHPRGGRGLPDRHERAHLQRRGDRQQDDARAHRRHPDPDRVPAPRLPRLLPGDPLADGEPERRHHLRRPVRGPAPDAGGGRRHHLRRGRAAHLPAHRRLPAAVRVRRRPRRPRHRILRHRRARRARRGGRDLPDPHPAGGGRRLPEARGRGALGPGPDATTSPTRSTAGRRPPSAR